MMNDEIRNRASFSKESEKRQAKDYIVFPLDVSSPDDAKRYVELLADHVGLFKVGFELFISSGPDIVRFINTAGGARVFLDLKLHDIPATVSRAMAGIVDLDIRFATVHCGETPKMLEAAVGASQGRVNILGVTVLTSVNAEDIRAAGYRPDYYQNLPALVLQRAEMARTAGCVGVVCSGFETAMIKEHFGNAFITVTPGIRPQWSLGEKDDQKRITTPAQAVQNGSDYLVIGRPIRDASDSRAAAARIADEIASAL
jgi:orotidine-5'-phosphate decarboxylase